MSLSCQQWQLLSSYCNGLADICPHSHFPSLRSSPTVSSSPLLFSLYILTLFLRKDEVPISFLPPSLPPLPPPPAFPCCPHLQLGRSSLHLPLLVQLPTPRQRPLPLPHRQTTRDPRLANNPNAPRRHGLQSAQRLSGHRVQQR